MGPYVGLIAWDRAWEIAWDLTWEIVRPFGPDSQSVIDSSDSVSPTGGTRSRSRRRFVFSGFQPVAGDFEAQGRDSVELGGAAAVAAAGPAVLTPVDPAWHCDSG